MQIKCIAYKTLCIVAKYFKLETIFLKSKSAHIALGGRQKYLK